MPRTWRFQLVLATALLVGAMGCADGEQARVDPCQLEPAPCDDAGPPDVPPAGEPTDTTPRATSTVAAGSHHSLALRRDGTVWAWGDTTSGQVGDGTSLLMPTPIKALLPR
jgi:hypothetical protein